VEFFNVFNVCRNSRSWFMQGAGIAYGIAAGYGLDDRGVGVRVRVG
jgi:hypothetical protein